MGVITEPLERHGLTLFPTSDMTRAEWLAKRQDGIGGSDISSILGLNYRFSAVELFYQKVGLTKQSEEENEAMFWGTRHEDMILKMGQYYNFDTGQYKDHYNTDTKQRRITKVRFMVNNPAYPWLLANIDGAVDFSARNWMMKGPAEAKAISRQTADMWSDRIPAYHIIQIMTYCIVCQPMMTTNEACIFYLEDGNKFRGYRIPVSESIKEKILEKSKDFWERVVKGREIMANTTDTDTRLQYLAQIEPDAVGTEAYYEFISELFRMKTSFVQIDAKEADVKNCLEYSKLSKQIKALEAERQHSKNAIMKSLHDAGANILMLPKDQGKVTWNKKLYVNVYENLKQAQAESPY